MEKIRELEVMAIYLVLYKTWNVEVNYMVMVLSCAT